MLRKLQLHYNKYIEIKKTKNKLIIIKITLKIKFFKS